ncbi:unnamed protein product [Prorocentrum cordatum]|uniref:Uncharacterized protein n=1 Tax=Prorocentrum cordatum TaxID=2364126 RepID=A0ABN9X5D0_9DINO|nr:unnamed protein product [Polarella glacialis]
MSEPTVIFSYSAGISACEKGEQWQPALALLSEMREAKLEPDAISSTIYFAGISACEQSGQWQWALALLACGKVEQWQRALALLRDMWEAKQKPNSATTPGSARARRASSGSGRWCC